MPSLVLDGLRRQEDSWVFEDPVTEAIAPGYHEQISMPMDYSTVESRLEKKHYTTRQEVLEGVAALTNGFSLSLRLTYNLSSITVWSITERTVSTLTWLIKCWRNSKGCVVRTWMDVVLK